MTPEALDLIFASTAAGGLTVLAGIRSRARRAVRRERVAHREAKWEARTRYPRGYAVVEVVRVARWDGKELVVDTDSEQPVMVPEDDTTALTHAQINAALRAEQRNTQ